MKSDDDALAKIIEIRDQCACLQARRRARYLTKAYDSKLAPSGLSLTQFSTVSALLAGPLSIKRLADALELDRTTLSRNLVALEKEGFVDLIGSDDARERLVSLTPEGVRATREAYALWQQAQEVYTSQ